MVNYATKRFCRFVYIRRSVYLSEFYYGCLAASEPKAVKAIQDAIVEMEKYTCLKFKKRDDEAGYILFANMDSKR